jgi:hypothetical protein
VTPALIAVPYVIARMAVTSSRSQPIGVLPRRGAQTCHVLTRAILRSKSGADRELPGLGTVLTFQ